VSDKRVDMASWSMFMDGSMVPREESCRTGGRPGDSAAEVEGASSEEA
jgi:hypothetical protein